MKLLRHSLAIYAVFFIGGAGSLFIPILGLITILYFKGVIG